MFSELGKKISNLIHLGDAPFSLGVYAANVARGEYDSVRGRISSSWKIEGGLFSLEVLIPPNTTATVHLPSTDAVSESGRPLEEAVGVELLRAGEGETILSVGSGRYEFSGRMARG